MEGKPDNTSSGSNSYDLHVCDVRDHKIIDDIVTEAEAARTTKCKHSHEKALDRLIYQSLEKAKDYFFNNEMEEQRLAEFLFSILTLNIEHQDPKDKKMKPAVLENIVDQIIECRSSKTDADCYNDLLENIFGVETAKAICETLYTDNIDDIIEKLFGKDAKQLICKRLGHENLDELLNKLVDEKLKQEDDPHAKHPNFDEFVCNVLGKETEDFLRKRMLAFLCANANIDDTAVGVIEKK